jgi:hypothetical protein
MSILYKSHIKVTSFTSGPVFTVKNGSTVQIMFNLASNVGGLKVVLTIRLTSDASLSAGRHARRT